MATYEVTLYFHTSKTVTVEADTEEEAINIAREEDDDEGQLVFNMIEDSFPDCYKID